MTHAYVRLRIATPKATTPATSATAETRSNLSDRRKSLLRVARSRSPRSMSDGLPPDAGRHRLYLRRAVRWFARLSAAAYRCHSAAAADDANNANDSIMNTPTRCGSAGRGVSGRYILSHTKARPEIASNDNHNPPSRQISLAAAGTWWKTVSATSTALEDADGQVSDGCQLVTSAASEAPKCVQPRHRRWSHGRGPSSSVPDIVCACSRRSRPSRRRQHRRDFRGPGWWLS